MYERIKSHQLPSSASSLYSNLDVLIEKKDEDGLNNGYTRMSFLCISKLEVNLLHCHQGGSKETSQVSSDSKSSLTKCSVLQAKWCRLKTQDVLVVANCKGLHILDGEGQLMMFWYSPSSEETLADESISPYCRGIACVNSQYICVGTYKGKVLVITAKKNTFSVSETLHHHEASVSAMDGLQISSENDQVDFISADDAGMLCTYKSGDDFSVVKILPGDSVPCTSLKLLRNGLMIVGYLSGQIRVFDPSDGVMLAEIAAHVRAVSCLDAISDKNALVLSGSEDSFIRVWRINRDDTISVKQEWFTSIRDTAICGARFCDPVGQAFALSGYDSREILQFSRVF